MAVIGRKSRIKPNIVPAVVGLPLDFTHGSISVSMNFESHPTGSINIEKIPEVDIAAYRSAYNVQGKEIILFSNTLKPIFFRINGYAETEDIIYDTNKSNTFRVFSISVNLEGGNSRDSKRNVYVRNSAKEYLPSYEPRVNVTNGKLGLYSLAKAAGVSYSGFSYFQDVESSSGSSYTVTFEQVLQSILRTKSSIVDYTGPSVKTTNYREGRIWQVGVDDILYSIEVNRQNPTEYRNTLLTGKNGGNFVAEQKTEEQKEEDILGDDPQKLPPTIQSITEGDKNPTRPPADVTQIRTLDMCFDRSGPRKFEKTTTLYNGQPIKEEVRTYGFVYTAQEIRNPLANDPNASIDTPALFISQVDLIDYWKQIEYQITTYNYEELNLNVRVIAEDANTGRKLEVKYLSSKDSSLTRFNSKYLTSVITTGWKLSRFQSEDLASPDIEIEDITDTRLINDLLIDGVTTDELELAFLRAQKNSLEFRRLPFSNRTQYKLYPSEFYYENIETSPFRIQEVSGSDIGYPSKDKVIVAIPDRQWVYPMVLIEETTLTQSFANIDNPRNIFVRQDRKDVLNSNLSEIEKQQALLDLKLFTDLTVGEDTFQKVERKILPSSFTNSRTVGKVTLPSNRFQLEEPDKYVEYESRASSHDQNFRNSIQNVVFRTILGRPTDASVLQERFGSRNDEKQDENSSDRDFEYRLTSSTNSNAEIIDSLQYETDSLLVAQKAAKAELILANFLNTYEENVNLAWGYFEIRPGDYISFSDDSAKGLRKVKSVSFNIQYKGFVDGQLITTCDGTSLVVGKFEDKSFSTSKIRKKDSNSSFNVKTSIIGERLLGTSPLPSIKTRKNPIAQEYPGLEDAI